MTIQTQTLNSPITGESFTEVTNDVEFSHILALSKSLKIPSFYLEKSNEEFELDVTKEYILDCDLQPGLLVEK